MSPNENDGDLVNEATPARTEALSEDLYRRLIEVDSQGKIERFS